VLVSSLNQSHSLGLWFSFGAADGNTWSFGSNPLAWARLIFSRRFWRLVKSMNRFHRDALEYLASHEAQAAAVDISASAPRGIDSTFLSGNNRNDQCIGEWLTQRGYDEALVDGWILPFCSAVWSEPQSAARKMHARSLLLFMRNHGFLSWSSVQWYTPRGRCHSAYLPRIQRWLEVSCDRFILDLVALQRAGIAMLTYPQPGCGGYVVSR